MVKIQVDSQGKALSLNGSILEASEGGSGNVINAINNTGTSISTNDKVYVKPLATPQSGANYEIVPVKISDSFGLGFYMVGEPTINLSDKTAYDFSQYRYLEIPKVFDYTQPWEFNICFQETGYLSGIQWIYFGNTTTYDDGGLLIYLNDDKIGINITYGNSEDRMLDILNYSISTNTTYYLRVGWTGTEYYVQYSTDGTTWTSETPITSSVQTYQTSTGMVIGGRKQTSAYFQGKVFLDKTYFISNGKIAWQAMYDGTWSNIGSNVSTGIATESIASGSVGAISTVL